MSIQRNFTEARANFARVWDQAINDRETIIITRRGSEDIALIAADELRSMEETLYLLRSPENARRLLAAYESAMNGEGTPQTLESLAEEVGIEIPGPKRAKRARVR